METPIKNAEEEARKLSEGLKESRESISCFGNGNEPRVHLISGQIVEQALLPSAPKQLHLQA